MSVKAGSWSFPPQGPAQGPSQVSPSRFRPAVSTKNRFSSLAEEDELQGVDECLQTPEEEDQVISTVNDMLGSSLNVNQKYSTFKVFPISVKPVFPIP